MSYLNEAFKELDELEDEVDLQSDEDVKQAIDFLNGDIDNTDHLEMVVDIDADDEEDLQDSYVGEILLMCPACHTLHYAHEEDIVPSDEEPDFVNVGEPCPHCKQENGFEIKGKVAEYVPEGEEPKEEETEDDILDIDDVEDEETEEEKAQFEESYRLRKQYVKDVAEDNLEDLARLTGIELPTTKRVTESKTKSLKENLTEAPLYDLKPQYDARQSFYNKATVDTGDKGDKNKLYSYNTLVAEMKDGKPVVYGTFSQTTLRHIKEWLKQNGFKAENAKQILADYGAKRESCKEAVTKQDDIDAQADNKKEVAKQEFEKKIDDADADRDDKLKEAKSNIVESAHRITINDDKITIDDDTYDLLDSNDEYYLFKDKNGVQEIRKDGKFDDERFFKDDLDDIEESKNLNEKVQDEAYEIAEYIYNHIKDRDTITRDEYEEQFALACRELYGIDNVWEIEQDGNIEINGKTFDANDLIEGDIRGILSFNGYATIYEGENEGGLTNKEIEENLNEDSERDNLRATIKAQNHAKRQPSLKLVKKDQAPKKDDKECKDGECKKEIKESKLNESADNEYQKIIDRAKLIIDDGNVTEADEALWQALDEEPYLDDFEILKDLFRIDELFVGDGRDFQSVSSYIIDSIYDNCIRDVSDYFEEKHEEVEEGVEPKSASFKESVTTKLNKTLKEGLEKDEDEEEVVEEDEFEESLFENLVNRYCSRVYENVDNYKATSCSRDKGEFIVEGMLTYKNGTQEPTKFTFTEGKTNNATKKYVGINETFSNNKKAFTLNITKEGNKLLSESLYYNYTAKVDNKDYPIKGKVATPKRK